MRATPKRSGFVDLLEHDHRPARVRPELVDDLGERVLKDVVAEEHGDGLARGEVLGEPERLRDAALAVLVAEADLLEPEVVAVAQELEKVARVVPTRDDEDVVDPGRDELLDRVVDHRPVVDRQEVLVGHPRQREQPRAETAGQDDALHPACPSTSSISVRAIRWPAAT